MNDWISLLMMMLSAAEMALFSERMLFSSLSLPRLCACALLLALLQLLPLPLCLLMTPLLFVLTQLLNSRLMLSEILFPCTLYGLILNIQAMLPFQALSSVVLLLPLLLLTSRLQKLYEIFQQEKAASLLLTLIAYAQLLGASLLSLHDAFDLQLFLLVLCVMFTICADTLLLPLLHAMRHGTPEQAQMIRQAIEQGNGRHLLEPVLEAMNACGSLEWTRQRAEEEADKAIAALQVLPDTPWREALIGLAHIAVQRDR